MSKSSKYLIPHFRVCISKPEDVVDECGYPEPGEKIFFDKFRKVTPVRNSRRNADAANDHQTHNENYYIIYFQNDDESELQELFKCKKEALRLVVADYPFKGCEMSGTIYDIQHYAGCKMSNGCIGYGYDIAEITISTDRY